MFADKKPIKCKPKTVKGMPIWSLELFLDRNYWVIQHVIDYDTDIDYTLTFNVHCTESTVKSKYIFSLVKFTSLTNEKNIELRIFLWS